MRRAFMLLRTTAAASRASAVASEAYVPRIASRHTHRAVSGAEAALVTAAGLSRSTWLWGGALASAVLTAAAAAYEQPARLENDALEPEALQELARDLAVGSASDKERAVAMLSSLTMYIDHHSAILATPGVLDALLDTVIDDRVVPQVRNIALTCTADLMKDPAAHSAALGSRKFVAGLLDALKAEGAWQEGLDDGQVAQAQAARVVAELAGAPDNHPRLISSGLAAQVATQAGRLVTEFGSVGSEYASAAEVPGSMDAVSLVEEERFTAAAVFGLAGSPAGARLLADQPDTLKGVAYWASNSRDPILQRWGVGALARVASAYGRPLEAALEAGGVPALVGALNCEDPQAQCFASAAVGALAREGGAAADALARQGVGAALAVMVSAQGSNASEGVRQGVRKCALKAIVACVANPQLSPALQQAGVGNDVKVVADQGGFSTEEMRRWAQYAVDNLTL